MYETNVAICKDCDDDDVCTLRRSKRVSLQAMIHLFGFEYQY